MPFQNRSLKPDKTSSQDLSAAALSYTTDYGRRFKLECVYLKASVSITETITITLDSALGSDYDVVLQTYDMVSETSFIWRPQGEMNLQLGDEIKVQCTAANLTGVVKPVVKAIELTQ